MKIEWWWSHLLYLQLFSFRCCASVLRIPSFSSSSMASKFDDIFSFFNVLALFNWSSQTSHPLTFSHLLPTRKSATHFLLCYSLRDDPVLHSAVILLTGSRRSVGQKLHLSTLLPFLSPFGAPNPNTVVIQASVTPLQSESSSFPDCLSNKQRKPYLHKAAI